MTGTVFINSFKLAVIQRNGPSTFNQDPRAGQHLELYGEEYDTSAPISIFRILIPAE